MSLRNQFNKFEFSTNRKYLHKIDRKLEYCTEIRGICMYIGITEFNKEKQGVLIGTPHGEIIMK